MESVKEAREKLAEAFSDIDRAGKNWTERWRKLAEIPGFPPGLRVIEAVVKGPLAALSEFRELSLRILEEIEANEKSITCPSCGSRVPDFKFCGECGTRRVG